MRERMDIQQSKKRILMLPWLGLGHISPFLQLAKKFSDRNFYIYICSTPILLSSIKKKLDDKHSLSIQLIELNLPSSPELPPHYHTTNGLPPNLMPTLISTFNTAGPPFLSDILKTLIPDFVIYDHHQLWAPIIASSQNIPAARFFTTAALPHAMVLHLFQNPGNPFPFPEIPLSWLENIIAQNSVEPSANQARIERQKQYLESQRKSCDIVLVRTFRDLEGKYIDYLSVLSHKKMVPVGPLLQTPSDYKDENDGIIQWLATKSEASTIYISFGSESFLSKEDTTEMAYGLKYSDVNFIWVMRFPLGEKIRVQEALPDGFLDGLEERGMMVEDWAPQTKILSHSSIGGFVSHCGWSSILESMRFGIPVVAVPSLHDQPMNAKLVEAVGMGIEVKRDENGRLTRGEIAQVIRKIMAEKDGKEIRFKARELSRKISRKGDEEIDEAVKEIIQVCMGRK